MTMTLFVSVLLCILCVQSNPLSRKTYANTFTDSNGNERITSLSANEPGLCDTTVKSYAGYFSAGGNKEYFYWFFEARNNPLSAPLIMWLTGGPGCSSTLALLAENGPCHVNSHASDTYLSNTSWTTNANVVWVDQPPGTGFSTGKKDLNEDEIAADMYAFLQNFMSAFPQYIQNGFIVIGESYAGHYIPAITYHIYAENKNSSNPKIPLIKFAIGNGLTDPYIQFEYYALMAYNSTTADHVINQQLYQEMTNRIPECQKLIAGCNEEYNNNKCDNAYTFCILNEIEPVTATGVNPYDLDIPCEYGNLCYNFTAEEKWLNNKTVQSALGVDERWSSCNYLVNELLQSDWMINYQDKLPPMLEDGIAGLIYAGDLDFICNYMGNQAWTLALNWTGSDAFNKAPVKVWSPDGKARGNIRSAMNFTFLQVYNAGHMVPMDQNQSALLMVNQFITNTL